jgi:hypothetical protein
MSQINSYAKSNKINLCNGCQQPDDLFAPERTRGEFVELAGIFPAAPTSN